MWTPDEAKKSSTFRELSAVFITLFSLLPDFQNRLVKIYTDNQNVVKIVQAGSMRSELQEIALKIFNLCILNCISLEVEWVPRELNTTADFNNIFRFKHSHWESLKQFSNPDLKALTVSLCSVVTASKSENTLNKYKGYFKRFKYWCLKYNLPFLPTTVCTVAIYLNYLIQSGVSTAVLNAAYYSIKWEHDLNLYDSILNDKLLEMVLEGGIRLLSKPLKRKEPITPTILKSIIAKFDKNDNLPGLRICAMMMLGFSGFLRYDELAHIRSSDLTFNDSHLQINIQKSKTDRYRQGNSIFNF
ncbi:unnamed protein product [Mytilus coruscus]|uniref:Tyr recombinase domain-containing protein n=1 Tax=Mytilus coruscus TaxID=42192 RepID=A0A6J8F2A3_MYTCO|nr:unnamed protein product [Mytilus coruscus]